MTISFFTKKLEYTLQKYPTLQNSVSDEKSSFSKAIQEYKKLITSIENGKDPPWS
jgi:hypothetical protein